MEYGNYGQFCHMFDGKACMHAVHGTYTRGERELILANKLIVIIYA